MRISDVDVVAFRTTQDRWGSAMDDRWGGGGPLPGKEIVQTITRVATDEGLEGYAIGGQEWEWDGLDAASRGWVCNAVRPLLVGQDPLDRELFWHWMWAAKIPEHALSAVDLALWDLAGQVTGLPIHKLLGGCRDRVPAYASTWMNLGQPERYAEHALECKRLGYHGYKIHPYYYWDPATGQAVPGRPSHVDWDIRVCNLVREAVGPEMRLMYDPWGTYHTMTDALRVGRELERLGFYWYEHPMPEYRVGNYLELSRRLSIPICSPELVDGSIYARADWIKREASQISRIDVFRGGITGAAKMAAICEAFGIRGEVHLGGLSALHVLGATSDDVCEHYERGLLGPGFDYENRFPFLRERFDVLQEDGTVLVPRRPGLGYAIDWDYVRANTVSD